MPAKIHSSYDDEALAMDIAKSDLSLTQIAKNHKVSTSLIYQIAKGITRPEILVRVNELLAAEKDAAMRLVKKRVRNCVGRLVQIANQDNDKRAAITAIEKILEMAGMLTGEGAGGDKQTIEIVLSAGKDGKTDPLKRRMTGVVNGNN